MIVYQTDGTTGYYVYTGSTWVRLLDSSQSLTSGSVTYPSTDGTSGQVLYTNGSGNLSWMNPSVAPADYISCYASTGAGAVQSLSLNSYSGITILANNQIKLSAGKVYEIHTTIQAYNFNENLVYSYRFKNVTDDSWLGSDIMFGNSNLTTKIPNYLTQPLLLVVAPSHDIAIQLHEISNNDTKPALIGNILIKEIK